MFKRGDIIKPKEGSPFEPEHWRYVVVHAFANELMVLDPNWNRMRLDKEWRQWMEVDPKPEEHWAESVGSVLRGEADCRFDDWIGEVRP